ncbi:MAG TPA: type II secretion system minor pseudopilin GspK [Steroidobacteraceae bacterium]|nr:type II secretion system minor pseudopilin GspK [Steroidobacteraceae bacterium]
MSAGSLPGVGRQRGIALLVAIVMFAIATTVAAAITYNKAMAARRAAATFALEQALQAGMAAEALAALVLEDDGGNTKTEIHRDWAQPMPPTEITEGIWVAGQLEDLTDRFNLNSLVTFDQQRGIFVTDARQVQVFQQLLTNLKIDVRYADLLADWLDGDINPQSNGGGEDTLYLTQMPPYLPPNNMIVHPSELLALPGFGAENYSRLAPFVTALPFYVGMNPCTAPGMLLDVNSNEGQQQWQNAPLDVDRKKGCSPDLSRLGASFADPAKWGLSQPYFNEKSSWFRLRTNIRIGTAEFVLYSVLFREQSNRVRVFQRSFGSE